MRILVVEDDRPLREALAAVLREFGYEVATAENGAQALERIDRERPNLIFVDLVMPIMSGFRLIQTLQTDSTLADIPTVAMTACSFTAPVGVEVMRKPFPTELVLEIVRTHCGNPRPD